MSKPRPSELKEINKLVQAHYEGVLYEGKPIKSVISLIRIVDVYTEGNDRCDFINSNFYIYYVKTESPSFVNDVPIPYNNVLFIYKNDHSRCFLRDEVFN